MFKKIMDLNLFRKVGLLVSFLLFGYLILFVYGISPVYGETLYEIDQKKAFSVANNFMGLEGNYVGKVPVPSISCVMGEEKGPNAIYKYKEKQLEQRIFVLPVIGTNENNKEIRGFQFKVIGDDIPDYQSIVQIQEKIKIMLSEHSVDVKKIIPGKYENYGYGDKSTLEKMALEGQLTILMDLGNECIITPEYVSELTKKFLSTTK